MLTPLRRVQQTPLFSQKLEEAQPERVYVLSVVADVRLFSFRKMVKLRVLKTLSITFLFLERRLETPSQRVQKPIFQLSLYPVELSVRKFLLYLARL